MSHADLSYADLSDADLFRADLREANLREANLSDEAWLPSSHLFEAGRLWADLREANLRGADLTGADGVSNEMLEQQTKLLSYTTMPDETVFFGEFEPALSLNPGGGSFDWHISEAKTPDSISLSGPENGLLFFTNPLQAFDLSNPSEPKEFSEPENAKEWVAWVRRQPNLDTSKPLPVRVGSASGKQIDVAIPSTPENYPQEVCHGQHCVPRKNGIVGQEAFKVRFVFVDVGGQTVLIDVFAPADRFDEFLPKAQEVLNSVEWEGG